MSTKYIYSTPYRLHPYGDANVQSHYNFAVVRADTITAISVSATAKAVCIL